MALKQIIRDAIVGKGRYITSHSVYKTTILRGYFAVIFSVTALVYLSLDIAHGVYGNFLIYGLLFAISISTLLLNRAGKYLLANILLLTVANLITFVFSSGDKSNSGVIMFFITTAMLALAVFEYRQKTWWLSFVLCSFCLFAVAYFTEFSVIEKISFAKFVVAENFPLNFSFAFLFAIMMISFRMRMNHHAENRLIENEASLIYTTEELTKSRHRFEMAIKGANAGIWEWNVASDIIYTSPVWKTMLGFEQHEISPSKIADFLSLVYHEDRSAVKDALQQHLTTGSPYQMEFRMMQKEGTTIWVKDSGISIPDPQGMTIQMIGSITDISESKKTEQHIIEQNEMLAKTNAELDRFVYSTSHDLRSPLSSLLGLITIAEKTDDPKEVEACHRMMKDRIRAMESFIKEIIDYSRNTRLQVKQDAVKMFPLIKEVVESLRFSDGAENIFVKYNIPAELEIYTDENRLKVVLNNLIGNSLKYFDTAKDNPYISIDVAHTEDHVSICVEDNGIGIANEHQSKIFDMFYRASEKSHGSGLGLYIVKETVEKLNGKVSVSSQSGKGTSFHVRLPRL